MGSAVSSKTTKSLTQDISDVKEEEPSTFERLTNWAVSALDSNFMTLYNHKAKYHVNNDGSLTFWPAPQCKPSQKHKKMTKMTKTLLLRPWRLEASSNSSLNVVDCGSLSSFIGASLDAWSKHYPIRFKPEHIWLLILQAVAVHVEKNAEKLRTKYVHHKGKMSLIVQRDNFVLGSDKNDWEGVIEEFVEQIDANTVKDTVQLFDCDFSGSSITEQICTKVTIMDICQSYFGFVGITSCGFPQITLDGTKSDWIRLKQKTNALLKTKVDDKFGAKWAAALIPVLDRFIRAFDGEIDCLFWNSMIKRGAIEGSGGLEFYSGWFNVFYPFTSLKSEDKYCVPYSMKCAYVRQGLTLERNAWKYGELGGDVWTYPCGLSQVPVQWKYRSQQLDLTLIAGFMGYQQDPKTLEICPNVGWCLAHEQNDESSSSNSSFLDW